MLAIRMRRTGSKKRPFFRIVVTDSRAPRDSRAVEILGFYDPRRQPETLRIDHEKYAQWLGKGARPSDSVRTLVERNPPVEGDGDADAATGPAQAPATASTAEPAAPSVDGSEDATA